MERILLRNGIPEPMPRIEGTYLYQTLHVRGRRPLWLDRHTELLARNIQELFGLRWAPDLRRLEAQIATLLDANRHQALNRRCRLQHAVDFIGAQIDHGSLCLVEDPELALKIILEGRVLDG